MRSRPSGSPRSLLLKMSTSWRGALSLLDVNVWLALVLSKHVHHSVASEWLALVDEPGTVVLCRSVQLSLLRLLTTAAVLAPYGNPPLTNGEAWSICEEMASDDRVLPGYPEPPGIEPLARLRCPRSRLAEIVDGRLLGRLHLGLRLPAGHHGRCLSPVRRTGRGRARARSREVKPGASSYHGAVRTSTT
jgi:predicted nucleic acid-binding protein